MAATLTLGQQGRLVIPAEVRMRLGLQPGDRLRLRVSGNSIILERPEDDEPGADMGASSLDGSALSAANLAEVVGKLPT